MKQILRTRKVKIVSQQNGYCYLVRDKLGDIRTKRHGTRVDYYVRSRGDLQLRTLESLKA